MLLEQIVVIWHSSQMRLLESVTRTFAENGLILKRDDKKMLCHVSSGAAGAASDMCVAFEEHHAIPLQPPEVHFVQGSPGSGGCTLRFGYFPAHWLLGFGQLNELISASVFSSAK